MRLLYLTQIKFSSPRAHVYNVARTCDALSKIADTQVTLVSTDGSLINLGRRREFIKKHHISDKLQIVSLGSAGEKLPRGKGRIFSLLRTLLNNQALKSYLKKNNDKFDVIYFRDHLLFGAVRYAQKILKKKIYYESHHVLHPGWSQKITEQIAKNADGIVAISQALKDYYIKSNSNIIVSYCGAPEPDWFHYDKTASQIRSELNLPQNKTIIGYIGNLGITGTADRYQLEPVIKALPYLPKDVQKNTLLVLTGEKDKDAQHLRVLTRDLGLADRVKILPWQERDRGFLFLRAYDILILPKRSKDLPGDSPLKMFEYLGAKRPIIAANSPMIREIIHDQENGLIVKDNEPESWAKAINRILTDKSLAKKLSTQALADSKKYSWNKRGEDIIRFIKANA